MSREAYQAAMAVLPYKRCDCGAIYHSARCPYCKPALTVAKPDFRTMPIDMAKAALLKELFG